MNTEQSQLFSNYEQKFKALADQKRLAILYEIKKQSEVCVCELEGIIDLPQSKLSYHLKLLLDADLLKCRKEGRCNYYSINEKAIKYLLPDDVCCIFYPPTV
ncbi:ArsR/SmtB family transcription factor [Paenibacillus sp. sgz5001063]|uniref:ArsR/SmtB family transcription factor n=1 Tax=Paenibacillus sp. sgz5001063 TaxID=3242474 RepID=UPI0036D31808